MDTQVKFERASDVYNESMALNGNPNQWDYGRTKQIYLFHPETNSETVILCGDNHFFRSLDYLRENISIGVINADCSPYFAMWLKAMHNIGWIIDVIGQMVLIYPNSDLINLKQFVV